jgi:hypothetical protein
LDLPTPRVQGFASGPGCVKTASKLSRRNFLWILKLPASIKSTVFQTATLCNLLIFPLMVVLAGFMSQPRSGKGKKDVSKLRLLPARQRT